MLDDHRIKYNVPVDYSEDSDLEKLVGNIIFKTSQNEKLEARFFSCQKERNDAWTLLQRVKEREEQEIQKQNLIVDT